MLNWNTSWLIVDTEVACSLVPQEREREEKSSVFGGKAAVIVRFVSEFVFFSFWVGSPWCNFRQRN